MGLIIADLLRKRQSEQKMQTLRLGNDGWELISLDNTGDNNGYRADMIFKRPKP